MYKKIIFLSIIFLFLFSFSAFSEENTGVTAEELDIEEPGIASWFNDAVNTVQIWLTRDPIKKAELELKKASRQLVRARKVVQDNSTDAELQGRLEMIDNKYEGLIDKINDRVEQSKKDNPDNDKLKSFLDKYTDHQLKHQEILQKLEEQVPEEVVAKIKEKREAHLEKFGEVMSRVQEKKEFKERLRTNLENGKNVIQIKRRAKIIEELGEKDTIEIRERVQEMKRENKDFFQDEDKDENDKNDEEENDKDDEDEENNDDKGNSQIKNEIKKKAGDIKDAAEDVLDDILN